MSWDRPFDQPVPLPSGPPARTLRDAANYIKMLPKHERDTPEWRLAVQMLIGQRICRGSCAFGRHPARSVDRTSCPGPAPPRYPLRSGLVPLGEDGGAAGGLDGVDLIGTVLVRSRSAGNDFYAVVFG
jgi:hypothetical protein